MKRDVQMTVPQKSDELCYSYIAHEGGAQTGEGTPALPSVPPNGGPVFTWGNWAPSASRSSRMALESQTEKGAYLEGISHDPPHGAGAHRAGDSSGRLRAAAARSDDASD